MKQSLHVYKHQPHHSQLTAGSLSLELWISQPIHKISGNCISTKVKTLISKVTPIDFLLSIENLWIL